MKSVLAFRECFGETPAAGPANANPAAHPLPLRSVCAVAPSWQEGPQLSIAIEVVGRLAEEASRIAHRGPGELAMSNAFEATFAYLVEYLRDLTIGQHAPYAALARSATARMELTARELEWLRKFAAQDQAAATDRPVRPGN